MAAPVSKIILYWWPLTKADTSGRPHLSKEIGAIILGPCDCQCWICFEPCGCVICPPPFPSVFSCKACNCCLSFLVFLPISVTMIKISPPSTSKSRPSPESSTPGL
ncbi:hypothetical protein XELAEV_18032502mg [Xenopus laevis]|uniref:Uncharacterized protein n=1 Tax=Xenopus laevis TaxID=8355 RepID=A0A974CPP2_XENLA|nr:hypothetical protein XELAEV_18032502mg [Xenopus laevis]